MQCSDGGAQPRIHRQLTPIQSHAHPLHWACLRSDTLEDPSANFSLLVEAVATRLCWAALNSAPLDADGNVEERALKAIAQKYKVSKDPLTLATETFLLSKLDRSDAAQYKQYRIKVKRRLHGLFKDDLAEIEDKAERLKLLQMSYEQTETNYRNLINKMQTRT
ncbi:hypothetical protein SARC_08221 [Sphaeroforma arctica JP610]|uniref:Uncharacterized protein n=1 Tax=Sphaeroforma arctica JP610 TaxID=667725 RepID=A0A0L0FRI4_9EUKA|nr:hypothetical protein SARC_08221 [Sphaeroforma arctica JP610]KNC79385.1 hypothetical protein SARC_08221 [Sphaeroforma arctica JP610]|eukprot:XP_014153287.1 hypothetical protein SARC_08221 [Sphaeroforma arctica JP610]